AGHARFRQLILLLLFLVLGRVPCRAEQEPNPDAARISAAQHAFDAGQWEDAARLSHGSANQSPDLDFLEGMALAKLQRWEEAGNAFETGRRKALADGRFPVELAGVRYQQKDYGTAKRELLAALRLNSHDAYTR